MDEKYCPRCMTKLPISEWGRNKSRKDGLQSICRSCTRANNSKRYKESPNYKKRLTQNKDKYRNQNREYVWNYLKSNPCVDCGECDPIVLEFDHVRDKKKFNISFGVINKTLASVKEEILKCDVRCANCHRRKTHKQLNYYIPGGRRAWQQTVNLY